jgi:predicted RNA-binding Zn-ribbon protein involved in translation (DUF1610 family)
VWVVADLVERDQKRKRLGGRLPKHLKKTKHPTDPWIQYRPLRRTWECENCKFDIKRDPDIKTLDFTCPRCGGKFIRTSNLESALKDPYTEYGWILFLESRKGKGKDQFLEIQSIILERESENEDGWVPYGVIEANIKLRCSISKNQLDRLLADMVKHHIVVKTKKKDPSLSTINKNRIFYRYNSWAAVRTMTEKGYKNEYSRLFTQNIDLAHQLIHATAILNRHGLLQEYHDDLRKWNERKMPSAN